MTIFDSSALSPICPTEGVRGFFAAFVLLAAWGSVCCGQRFEINSKPFQYESTDPSDAIARLQKRIETGEVKLTWSDTHGWLPSLIEQLQISPSSQLLVFSKTSLQTRKIRPRNPRAIYFNDDVYIGFIPGAPQIELMAVDDDLGGVFYTMAANRSSETESVEIQRETSNCTSCHQSRKTQHVPGFLVRSVFPSPSGQPRFELGTTTTDVSTAFQDRFGGWYITGRHGQMRHRGNTFAKGEPARLDYESGANQTALPNRIKAEKYLTDSSDVVAMMVLEHQSQMHNAITNAVYATRKALHDQAVMDKVLDRDPNVLQRSTVRRINKTTDNLVKHLLFHGEWQLTDPISSDSPFIDDFQKSAIHDHQQRSLRQFDLQQRLFKYPCSYLIYSRSFDAIPKLALEMTFEKMYRVLTSTPAEEQSDSESLSFEHLSANDRQAILEILVATKPSFKRFVETGRLVNENAAGASKPAGEILSR